MTNEIVYVVERIGVYQQGILGVFRTLDAAKARAEAMTRDAGWRTDGDGYHDFRVVVLPLDVSVDVQAHTRTGVVAVWSEGGQDGKPYAWQPTEAA